MQHLKRLRRDIQELFSRDLHGEHTHIKVHEVPISSHMDATSNLIVMRIQLSVCLLSGPYRGGHFSFGLDIPSSYPFKCPQVWAFNEDRPIWHPNIDLRTGEVALPLEWSPVLTLSSLTLAIQMMLLTPSNDHPLNIEAYKLLMENPNDFDDYVQSIMEGCNIGDYYFPDMHNMHCQFCNARAFRKKAHDDMKVQENELPRSESQERNAQIEFEQLHTNKSPFEGRKRSRSIVEEQLSLPNENSNRNSYNSGGDMTMNVLANEFGDSTKIGNGVTGNGNRKRERDEIIDHQGNDLGDQSRTATPSLFSQTNINQSNHSNVFNPPNSLSNDWNFKKSHTLFSNSRENSWHIDRAGGGNEKVAALPEFKRSRMDCTNTEIEPEENDFKENDFNSHSHRVFVNMEVNVFRPVLLENENLSFGFLGNQNPQNQTTPLFGNPATPLFGKGFTFSTPMSASTDHTFFDNSKYSSC